MSRLRRSDCSAPGWTRRRAGKGWSFLDEDGRPIRDPEVRERLLGLAIPPAWRDVWICPHPMGHVQATGLDDRGRRQYRYHEQWRAQRDREKFDRVLGFAEALLAARPELERRLDGEDLTRERVLACAVRLLDLGFFRIGGEEYAEENRTYGLATMRKEHVSVSGDAIVFDYVAKSGKHRVQSVADERVRTVVQRLRRRRGGGPELLAYRDGSRWVDVKSADVNAAVQELLGDDYTAKDFRTWSATVLAAVGLAVSEPANTSPTASKRAVTRVVKEVAGYLGNTPAVCRSSYIDPRVVDLYQGGRTIDLEDLGAGADPGQPGVHGGVERAVLALLRGEDDATGEGHLERLAS